jgi:hypothetical protein
MTDYRQHPLQSLEAELEFIFEKLPHFIRSVRLSRAIDVAGKLSPDGDNSLKAYDSLACCRRRVYEFLYAPTQIGGGIQTFSLRLGCCYDCQLLKLFDSVSCSRAVGKNISYVYGGCTCATILLSEQVVELIRLLNEHFIQRSGPCHNIFLSMGESWVKL